MAKIGIVTFTGTIDNYGQVLQYLATQEYLKTLGHSASLVVPNGYRKTLPRRVKWKLQRICNKAKSLFLGNKDKVVLASQEDAVEQKKISVFKHWAEVSQRKELECTRKFNQFRDAYFSQQTGTYDDILESGYDAYCVGSDQTWSAAGFDMMLGWVPAKYKRFSIAPSVGHREYSEGQIDGFKAYLKAFDFITVREDKGVALTEKCGRNDAVKILDPTFLLTAKQYRTFSDKMTKSNPYIFIYLLGGEIEPQFMQIIEFCKASGYEVKYVESQGREENFPSISATVGQWINLIDQASYVLTNSFHGMAFSVIFNKPFLVFPLVGIMNGMNGRIFDLANLLQLNDRIYRGDFQHLFNKVNWEYANQMIKQNRVKLSEMIHSIGL